MRFNFLGKVGETVALMLKGRNGAEPAELEHINGAMPVTGTTPTTMSTIDRDALAVADVYNGMEIRNSTKGYNERYEGDEGTNVATDWKRSSPSVTDGGAAHILAPVSPGGYTQGTPLSVTTLASQTAALTAGVYMLWLDTGDSDVELKIATTANDVAIGTGIPLWAGNMVPFIIGVSEKIGAITAAGTATLHYHRIG